jgi:iron complex transport system permease protein
VRGARATLVLIALGALLVASVLLSVGTGAVAIAPLEVVAILLARVGIELGVDVTPRQEAVLLAIRLPRVLLGVLVGAALAVAGAAMQGLFRNPLADPGLLGVSSGAALAAVTVIVVGGPLVASLGVWVLPAAAFIGSLLATLVVYALATAGGRTAVATMLLAGIAINALAGSGTGLFVFMADDAQLRDITFWSLGSLGGATWRTLSAAAPFMLAAIFLLPQFARALNAFLLGEAEARHLGVNVETVKLAIVFVTACAVGAAVSVSGIIGFIGLVVPHLIRLVIGPDHRILLPGTVLLGASLLLLADLLARTVVAPAELPIGIVTSLVGGPFFLWLLLRFRRRGGLV